MTDDGLMLNFFFWGGEGKGGRAEILLGRPPGPTLEPPLAGRPMFSTCSFVRLFVYYQVMNAILRNEWTNFNANWHKSFNGAMSWTVDIGAGGLKSRLQEAEVMFGSLAQTSFSIPWV